MTAKLFQSMIVAGLLSVGIYYAGKTWILDPAETALVAKRATLTAIEEQNAALRKLGAEHDALVADIRVAEQRDADISRRIAEETKTDELFGAFRANSIRCNLNLDAIKSDHPPFVPGKTNKSPLTLALSSPTGGDPNADPRFQVTKNQIAFLGWLADYERLIAVEAVIVTNDQQKQRVRMEVRGYIPIDVPKTNQGKPTTK